MRLVADSPIFNTIQGEGIYAGTPSIFVRLHGCDFSCSWCDTKQSWKPGSLFTEMSVDAVMHELLIRPTEKHVVITGGNPFLQAEELALLIRQLSTRHTVTVETQGSIYSGECLRAMGYSGLLSLSPKLHNWQSDALGKFLRDVAESGLTTQVKIVFVDTVEATEAVRRMLHLAVDMAQYGGQGSLHFVLQPEYSAFKRNPRLVREVSRLLHGTDIRIIPQLHKHLYGLP